MTASSSATAKALSHAVNRCYRDIADPGVREWIVPLHVSVLLCAAEGNLNRAKAIRQQLVQMCAGRHIGVDLIMDIEKRACSEMYEVGFSMLHRFH